MLKQVTKIISGRIEQMYKFAISTAHGRVFAIVLLLKIAAVFICGATALRALVCSLYKEFCQFRVSKSMGFVSFFRWEHNGLSLRDRNAAHPFAAILPNEHGIKADSI